MGFFAQVPKVAYWFCGANRGLNGASLQPVLCQIWLYCKLIYYGFDLIKTFVLSIL